MNLIKKATAMRYENETFNIMDICTVELYLCGYF